MILILKVDFILLLCVIFHSEVSCFDSLRGVICKAEYVFPCVSKLACF